MPILADKTTYAKEHTDALFKVWGQWMALGGAVGFLLLAVQDYVSTPENFILFFTYRLCIAAWLLSIFFIARRLNHRGIQLHRALAILGVIGSATAVELMIMRYGGHASTYYVGQMLIAVICIGFFPAGFLFQAGIAALIYAVYLIPILLFDTITQTQPFLTANIFMLFFMASSLLGKHMSWKGMLNEIGLQYDLEKEIADRNAAETQARESEAGYRQLFDSIQDAIYILDENGCFIDVNKGAELMYGYPREFFLGKTPDILTAPGINDMAAITDAARKAFEGAPQQFEFWGRRGSGEIFPKDVRVVPALYQGRRTIISVARDITERKQAENQLRQQRDLGMALAESRQFSETLRLCLDAAMRTAAMDCGAIYLRDYATGDLEIAEHTGLSPRFVDCVFRCPADSPKTRLVESGKPVYAEYVALTPPLDNIERTEGLKAIAVIPFFDEGRLLGCINVASHTMDQVPLLARNAIETIASQIGKAVGKARAEQALQRSESRFRRLYENMIDAFVSVDMSGRILEFNKAYEQLLGYSTDELRRLTYTEITPEKWHPMEDEIIRRQVIVQGFSDVYEKEYRRRDGSILPVELRTCLIRNEQGEPMGMWAIVRDISERLRAKEEQLKLQKLEAVGVLAGGIAHDFNNLLQGIFGYISLAKLNLNKEDKLRAHLHHAEEALNVAVNLTRQLLTFAKGGKPIKKTIDLRPVIMNAARLALSGARSDSRFILQEDLCRTNADEGQIGQVIQNIVLNASEAMPDGGTIEIVAENHEIPKGSNPALPEGGAFIRISIKDTGIGIPDQYLGRIFDPYFSTKQTGSGLGLATSYAIIKNHGGQIDVRSESGGGTTFIILLPISAAQDDTTCAAVAATGRKGRVLLMDDDQTVRNVSAGLIADLGHTVDCAAEGREAIEKYRAANASGHPYDIVILDLTVKGGMGGEDAIQELRKLDPNVTAVVTSGYSENPVMADFRAHGFKAVLSKPYTLEELCALLDRMITTRPSDPGVAQGD